MGFDPQKACYCPNCGEDYTRLIRTFKAVDFEEFNYCPTCGNELRPGGNIKKTLGP